PSISFTSSMPCLYLPLYPSTILTSPSCSLFSFLFSLIPSLCRTSIHLFFSIPLQLLFLTLHLSFSLHFHSFFQYFPSSLSLYGLYPWPLLFILLSFLNFCISCTGISFRKCIF